MKTIAELKTIFGLAITSEVFDSDGSPILVKNEDLDNYKFYSINRSLVPKEHDMAFFLKGLGITETSPTESTGEPSKAPVRDLMAMEEADYIYIVTQGDFSQGTLITT